MSLISEIKLVFQNYSYCNKLFFNNFDKAFNDLHLFLNRSKIEEIIQKVRLSNKNNSISHITLGEFTLLVFEVLQKMDMLVYRLQNQPKLLLPNKEKSMEMELITHPSPYVFLGGSCNPTSWRRDVAIPFLERHNITYYNPQVEEWYPELIQIEENAKRSSHIKLFVIDTATRSISSLVEAAYLASLKWKLVVVITYIPMNSGHMISGEILSETEIKELNRDRAFLCGILQREGVPVYNKLDEALSCILKIRDGRISYKDLVENRRFANQFHYGDSILKLKQLFDKYATIQTTPSMVNVLTIHNAELAIQEFTQTHDLPRATTEELKQCEGFLDFNLFCQLTAETIYQQECSLLKRSRSNFFILTSYLYNLIYQTFMTAISSLCIRNNNVFAANDITNLMSELNTLHLHGLPDNYAHDITKLMKNHGVSCQLQNKFDNSFNLQALANNKSILYIIQEDTTDMETILEASYLIGTDLNIVLVIQEFAQNTINTNFEVTKIARKDYTRGRAYLKETAKIRKIPVYETINEGVNSILQQFSN